MSETYTPAGNVGSSFQRATVGEAATGTHGQEFMRDDITKMADKVRFLSDLGYLVFPAAFSAQADVNTLDDYEEGTFAPTIAFGGASVGVTYLTQIGRYTKIGNRVFWSLHLTLTNKGSSTGGCSIAGLPFPVNAAAGNYQSVFSRIAALAAGITAPPQGYTSPGSTAVIIEKVVAGNAAAIVETDFTNTSELIMSGHYDT